MKKSFIFTNVSNSSQILWSKSDVNDAEIDLTDLLYMKMLPIFIE